MKSAMVFTEVLGLALWVEVALRLCRFESVLAGLAGLRPSLRRRAEIPPATLQRAIRAAYRLLPLEPTCLKQALIFCRAWRRRGLPAELRIGVQKKEGVFAAHAWVEDGAGNVLTDPQDGFSPVPLPTSSIRGGRASD